MASGTLIGVSSDPALAQGDPQAEPAAAAPADPGLVQPDESAPSDTTAEGNAGCEDKDDSHLVVQQVAADAVREFVDVTKVTVAEALLIASDHWEAAEAAFVAAAGVRAATFPTEAAPIAAGARAPGVETCRMLANPDLASCDAQGDEPARAACYALKSALSAPARTPSVCLLAPEDMRPSCRLVFGGDKTPCLNATGVAAATCKNLLAVAGREADLCGAALNPGRCLDALLLAGLTRGAVACDEVLETDGEAPNRRTLRDQCRAVLARAPHDCPADSHALGLRSTGDALLRASFGVAWLTFAVGANVPAMCAVKATVYEGDAPGHTEIATVVAHSVGQAFTAQRRLSREVHAARSVLGVQHVCVPTLSWEPGRAL